MEEQTVESDAPEPTAEALLNTAREYQFAATTLVPAKDSAESPLYFLYSHTIELALKAHLRSLGFPNRKIHDLGLLLEQSFKSGLLIRSDLRQVVDLLESENKEHGFRYFLFKATDRPEISYLHETVDELMAVVVEQLRKNPTSGHPNKAVMKFTVGKPVPK